MKTWYSLMAVLAACLLFSPPAEAVHSCSVTSIGAGAAYDPLLPTGRTAQSSVTVSCLRAAGDAAQIDYTLTANDGGNPSGPTNRATLGATTVSYELYRDSVCSTNWRETGNSSNYFAGTLDFGGALTASVTLDYWACIPSGQASLPAGSYTDLVTMILTYGNTKKSEQTAIGSFPVTVNTPAQCVISTAPGPVDFGTYVAFGPAAAASTTFGVTCTNYLPYTLALDATAGVVTGLNYVLSAPAAGVGTGLQQLLSITGNMPAGQAGQCASSSCTGTDTRTLTLSY